MTAEQDQHGKKASTGVLAPETQPPRAAYIHIPFCARKCGYCNFSVVAGRDAWMDIYCQAVGRELAWLGGPREVDTLYIGGGTPTHLPAGLLASLFETVLRWHPLAADSEWTVEANPKDLDADRLAVLAEYGVHRISLGGQSFNPSKLRWLERDHTASDIHRAADAVRAIGADLALDMIFAVPANARDGSEPDLAATGETPADWERDLAAAIALAPDHLSVYSLTIERGSAFYGRRLRGELVPLDEEIERAMVLAAMDRLTAAGYEHYEIANFARWRSGVRAGPRLETRLEAGPASKDAEPLDSKFAADSRARWNTQLPPGTEFPVPWQPGPASTPHPGPVSARSRHNQVYWQGEPYFAAGAGAARYVAGCREMNHRSTRTYIQRVCSGQSPVVERESLGPEARARERLVFALRQLDGVARSDFITRTGFQLDHLAGSAIGRFVELGLLTDDGDRIRLTRDGLLVSDALWPDLLG